MPASRLAKIGVLLTTLALAVFVITNTAYFRVQAIAVEGASKVAHEEIIAISGLSHGMHLASFKAGDVEAAVQAIPRIDRVSVRRMFPGTVRISVTEREPVAVLPHHSGFLVLDGVGRVIDYFVGGRIPWPVVTGEDVSTAVVGDFIKSPRIIAGLRCVSSLTSPILARLSEVNVREDGEVTLFLLGGVRVLLGQADAQIPKKSSTLESLLEDLAKTKTNASQIDLRFDKPVVRLGK